jgi:Protein of unknown function (DUF3071)
MGELTFVGLTDDGAGLVLSDESGLRHTVPLDERLSAAVRRDRRRLGQMEMSLEPLRPKDVQARIRGGATAEEVAEESGWDLDKVRKYEGPPLAERAWVAEQARGVEIRRPEGDARLEDLVVERLASRGVSDDALRWDSWRRDDGRWTVLLAYPAGQGDLGDRVATWTYETAGRTLHADDDEARWLIEEPTPEPEPSPQDEARLRLVGLPSVSDEEDAASLEQAVEAAGRHDTIPVVRPVPAEVVTVEESVVVEESVQVEVTQAEEHPDARGRGRRGKAKRASVPSWDEILFGAADREE